MGPSVTIVDYGIGNLRSIEKAFEAVGARVTRTDDPADVLAAERVVLPGVGAFGACVAEIRRRGLVDAVRGFVATGRPFMGVCVGMQLLFEYSTEMGHHRGLGLLPGRVVRFEPETLVNGRIERLKIPHMGWNEVSLDLDNPLLSGLEDRAFFYFVHSFHAVASRPEDVAGLSKYGASFPAIVSRGNIHGVQFHPEKSHRNGLHVLANFSNLRA